MRECPRAQPERDDAHACWTGGKRTSENPLGAKLGVPLVCCVGGGGTYTSASGVDTAAVSCVGLPQLALKTSLGPSSLPQFVHYLWATATLPP